MPRQTPSQTVGPFFAHALTPERYGRRGIADRELVKDGAPGEIWIEGRVWDGEGEPISDALIEIWQADASGRYHHPAAPRGGLPLEPDFKGFGRTGSDDEGRYRFHTLKPGRVAGRNGGLQAPHINVTFFARGLLSHAYTRIYFDDEAAANADDPVLRCVPEERRATLTARRSDSSRGIVYRFDIHTQGHEETVFFDI
ncbi:MAG TPA: protocatechuate 3,4-dioxygenase subunit alpha [Vicinamibacteria bacterium]